MIDPISIAQILLILTGIAGLWQFRADAAPLVEWVLLTISRPGGDQ